MPQRPVLSCQQACYKLKRVPGALTDVRRVQGDPEDVGVITSMNQVQAGNRGRTPTGLTVKGDKGSIYRGVGRVEGNPGHQAVPWGLLTGLAPLGVQLLGQGGNQPESEGLHEEGHPES